MFKSFSDERCLVPSYDGCFCVVAHSDGDPVIHLCAKKQHEVFFSSEGWSILHSGEEWYDGNGNFCAGPAERLWASVLLYMSQFRTNHGYDVNYPDTVIVHCPYDPNVINAMRLRWEYLRNTTEAYFRVSFSAG